MSGVGIFCATLHITVFDQTGSSLPLCLLGERTVKILQKNKQAAYFKQADT